MQKKNVNPEFRKVQCETKFIQDPELLTPYEQFEIWCKIIQDSG